MFEPFTGFEPAVGFPRLLTKQFPSTTRAKRRNSGSRTLAQSSTARFLRVDDGATNPFELVGLVRPQPLAFRQANPIRPGRGARFRTWTSAFYGLRPDPTYNRPAVQTGKAGVFGSAAGFEPELWIMSPP